MAEIDIYGGPSYGRHRSIVLLTLYGTDTTGIKLKLPLIDSELIFAFYEIKKLKIFTGCPRKGKDRFWVISKQSS